MQLHRLGVDLDSLRVTVPVTHGREADFSFLLTGSAQSYAQVWLNGSTHIKTFPASSGVAGWRAIHWDGLNDQGQQVGAGNYTISVMYQGMYSDDIFLRSAKADFSFTNPPAVYPPLVIELTGPTSIPPHTDATWNATVTGGHPGYNYGWTKTESDGSTTQPDGNNNYFTARTARCDGFTISLSVSSSDGQTQEASTFVSVSEQSNPELPGCLADPFAPGSQSLAVVEAPTQFEMHQNTLGSSPSFQLSGGLQRAAPSLPNSSIERQQLLDRARMYGITSLRFGVPRPAASLSRGRRSGTVRTAQGGLASGSTSGANKPITIRIYNMSGGLVRTAVHQTLEPGFYQYDWDGRTDSGQLTSPGVFVAILTAPGFTKSIKLVRVR